MSVTDEVYKLYDHSIEKIKDPYMVNRFLSFSEYAVLSFKVNKYVGRIPEWALRSVYLHNIKQQRRQPFIPYLGKLKSKKTQLIKKIAQSLCCSERHAEETIMVLRKLKYKPEQFFGLRKGE